MREDYLRHMSEVARRLGDKKLMKGFVASLSPETRYALCRAVTRQNRHEAHEFIAQFQERLIALSLARLDARGKSRPDIEAALDDRAKHERSMCPTCLHHHGRHDDTGRCEFTMLHADNRKMIRCPCAEGGTRPPVPVL